MRSLRRGHDAVITCHAAREAISARVDGEDAPNTEITVSAHLVICEPCRGFETAVVELRREMNLSVVGRTRDLSAEILSLLGSPDPAPLPPVTRVREWQFQGRTLFPRAAQWAVGVVPLGVAVPVLALGLFGHVHIVPSHVVTPCTVALTHHLRRR